MLNAPPRSFLRVGRGTDSEGSAEQEGTESCEMERQRSRASKLSRFTGAAGDEAVEETVSGWSFSRLRGIRNQGARRRCGRRRGVIGLGFVREDGGERESWWDKMAWEAIFPLRDLALVKGVLSTLLVALYSIFSSQLCS
jgi:hypothetical protein